MDDVRDTQLDVLNIPLDNLAKQIEKLGEFSEPNWNSRTIIEVAAKSKSQGWFLHAMTGQEWVLRLVFRVAKNSFKQADLEHRPPEEVLDAVFTPHAIGPKQQFDVGHTRLHMFAAGGEFRYQVGLRVDAGIGCRQPGTTRRALSSTSSSSLP